MASLEDIKINFNSSALHFETLPIIEILSFSFFNRGLTPCYKAINECLQCTLAEKNDGNSDRNFFTEKFCQC